MRYKLSVVLLLTSFTIIATGLPGCGGRGSSPQPLPLRVLVVHAVPNPAYETDIITKLVAFGIFATVDGFDAGSATPSLVTLQGYDVALVVKDSNFDDIPALGNVLADFVDGGGGVVVTHFTFEGGELTGRFLTDNYFAIDPGFDDSGGPFGMTPLIPHPILTGVTTFSGGTSSYRPENATVAAGATVVAEWADGNNTPLIVVRVVNGHRRCDLGFYPPTDDTGRANFVDSTTDALRIVANALLWVGIRI